MNAVMKIGLFCYYVFMGSTSVLVVKFSENGSGKLVYNVASAVFLIEFFKAMFSVICDKLNMCGSTPDSLRTTTYRNWFRYSGPGLLYAIQNNLGFVAISCLSPPLFSLLVNSKIIFAALCGKILLSQKFTVIQWVGLINLVFALCVSRIRTIGGDCGKKIRLLQQESLELVEGVSTTDSMMAEQETLIILDGYYLGASGLQSSFETSVAMMDEMFRHMRRILQGTEGPSTSAEVNAGGEEAAKFLLGITCVSFMAFTSGLSGAVNEWLLKSVDSDVALMRKNFWTYQWGMIFNGIGFFGTTVMKGKDPFAESPLEGFNIGVWMIITANVTLGLTVSMVLKYLDNVIKCIGGVLIIFFCTFVSWVAFNTSICPEFMLAVMIFGLSSFLYVGSHNGLIKKAIEAEEALDNVNHDLHHEDHLDEEVDLENASLKKKGPL